MLNALRDNLLKNNGSMLIVVLMVSTIFLVTFLGAIDLAVLQLKLNKQKAALSQALQIAEAGINNYRWMLYHDEKHYFDTMGCDYDTDCNIGTTTYNNPFDPGGLTGKYHISVHTPKKNGSSLITVTSIGWIDESPLLKKRIEVKIGKKSWSSYSILSNNSLNIESGSNINGRIHSNSGIRIDGIAVNLVTSALRKYHDPLHCGAEEYAVHSHAHEDLDGCDCPEQPGMPNECDRDERYDDLEFLAGNEPISMPDVFVAGRNFPVPTISFNVLGESISDMIAMANEADGDIIDPTTMSCASNCDEGFRIILNNNNYSVYRVDGTSCNGYQYTNTTHVNNYNYPDNGIILMRDRDKLWVEGNLDNDRVSILAFRDAIDEGNADIIISSNLTYSNDDGSEALGLIAQRNILVNKCIAGDDLEINAAMITKKGEINADAVDPINGDLTINGSIAAYQGFDFYDLDDDQCCDIFFFGFCISGWYDCPKEYGYTNIAINYDNNLTYNPPPHFPTTGEYTFISWKEK